MLKSVIFKCVFTSGFEYKYKVDLNINTKRISDFTINIQLSIKVTTVYIHALERFLV